MTVLYAPDSPPSPTPAGGQLRTLPVAPARVEVGPGAIARLGDIVAGHGAKALVVAGPHAWAEVEARLRPVLEAAGAELAVHFYDPDCTEASAAEALALLATRDVVVGVGGGKALDLAKLVAQSAQKPCVTVPTSAATCAAWTALGNFYQPTGAFDFGRSFEVGPSAVVVDTLLVAEAPARLLASGLADTLAKWYETSASVKYAGADMTTRAAHTMARMLHDEILSWGVEAYTDAKAGRLTPAVTRAIETNICLAGTVGGLGGEKCRSVAAHAVCNALTAQLGNAQSWHGEKVAFGILTQLLLQGRSDDATGLARFFMAIDIPVTLAGLGYHLASAQLDEVAAHVCRPQSTVHHLPFPVTPERVKAALVEADALGRSLSTRTA